MNGRPLTDAQISRALRAHLPQRAEAGLRERIFDVLETTTQQRPMPPFLASLTDADPATRRRSLLIAAAVLLGLVLAGAAAVGALRLLQRDPVRELSLEPPADIQAFVLSSYDRMPELPPVAMTWLDNGSAKGRIYVDRSGAVRFERYATPDATEPETYKILSGNRLGQLAIVGSDKVWVEQDEAISEDPRVFILAEIGSGPIFFGGPGCEMTRNGGVGNGAAATGWRYVGVEYVAGRPAHHVACVGDLWLDIETRVILRSRGPLLDDARQPIPGASRTIEVTEIAFGEQPAALFDIAPPTGVARMSSEAYQLYQCSIDPICSARQPTATPTPTFTPCVVPPKALPSPSSVLPWSQSSSDQDWPARVRPESVGDTVVRLETDRSYMDPVCDTEPSQIPWLDIVTVRLGGLSPGPGAVVLVDLAGDLPLPVADPTSQWIAYGLVFDTDGDGIPDRRLGIDNMPVAVTGEPVHRAWRTDLDTGETMSAAGAPYGYVGNAYFDTFYPGEWSGNLARFGVGLLPGESKFRFYAWASVIEDGRVVATDYAPDIGWLEAPP